MKLFIAPNLVDEIIDPKQLLKDKHIDAYIMIAQNQGFSLQDTHLISKVLTKNSTYKPVTTEGDVQILFREPTDNDEGIGHWLCCYYAQNPTPEVAHLRQYIKSCFESMKLLPFPYTQQISITSCNFIKFTRSLNDIDLANKIE